MFVSDKLVFLELHKTGCTHIRRALLELVGGECVGKHNQAGGGLFTPGRAFLGSVRDPWDWYVSLWAYGCDGKGAIYGNATRRGYALRGRGWSVDPLGALVDLARRGRNRHWRQWRRAYANVEDPGAFREWLHMLHDPDHRQDVGEGYGGSALGGFAGLMTYRFVRLFAFTREDPHGAGAIASPLALKRHVDQACFIDHFIRNEALEDDLLRALRGCRIALPADAEAALRGRARTNTSSRRSGAARYYDAASIRLVSERDALVVERFGYAPPVAATCASAPSPPGWRVADVPGSVPISPTSSA